MKSTNKKQVILKPVISEKSLTLYRNLRTATFIVEKTASKKDIAYNFEQMFGIKPENVGVVLKREESKSRNRKTYQSNTKRSMSKKAYINIGENKLDIFENIK